MLAATLASCSFINGADELEWAAELLETRFPERVGDWELERDLETSRADLRRAGVVGYVSGLYRNTRTQALLTASVGCARPKAFSEAVELSDFTAIQAAKVVDIELPGDRMGAASVASFDKHGQRLEVIRTYATAGKPAATRFDWVAPPSVEAMEREPFVYKLLVIGDATDRDPALVLEELKNFLVQVVPHLDSALAEAQADGPRVARDPTATRELARRFLAEGRSREALALFARHARLHPHDGEAIEEYARALLAVTRTSDATRNDVARAYDATMEAVRRNPDDDELRLQVAQFLLRHGRSDDARDEVNLLLGRLRERSADDAAAGVALPEDIQAALAAVFHGLGSSVDIEKAAEIAARLTGYDMEARGFIPGVPRRDGGVEPYLVLADILDRHVHSPEAVEDVLQILEKRHGHDAAAGIAIGRWHRKNGRLPEAEGALLEGMEALPGDAELRRELDRVRGRGEDGGRTAE